MVIYNAYLNNKLCSLEIDKGKITAINENCDTGDINAEGNIIISGLIDVHTHGIMGVDTMDADFESLCKFYAQNGTTSLLPTTMTMGFEDLKKVCNAKTDYAGSQIIGIHLEGPYISPKYKGAQNEKYIKAPDIKEFSLLKNVKMITVAPETHNALEFIEKTAPQCVVSIGHTDCDYETALKAIEKGADCLTHIYNAMPPLHHRNSGPIGAGIEKQIYAQVICDGVHISKPCILATYKMFGADKMILISDSLSCAGLSDGEYMSGGLKVILKDKTATLEDGTIAGSSATLLQCVKKAIEFGIPFEDAVKMASETPAEMLKLKKGKIEIGYDADLLIVDKDLNLKKVIIGGKLYN